MGEDTEEETKDDAGDETEEETDDSRDDRDDDAEEIGEELDAEEARLASGRNKVRVLDVRPQEEMADGAIPGAMWSDEDRLVEMARYVLRGDDIPVLVVCKNGKKSEELAEKLREEDIKACYLKGGFKSWDAKGYPQDPREDAEYEGPDITMPGTGGDLGGDESAEDEKIRVATEYREGQEEETGTNPIDARAETSVDQRDLEVSRKFERDASVQEDGLLDDDSKDLGATGSSDDDAESSSEDDSSDGDEDTDGEKE